jgi:hypothetical protein
VAGPVSEEMVKASRAYTSWPFVIVRGREPALASFELFSPLAPSREVCRGIALPS